MKFAVIDVNNLVHRSKHVIQQYESFDECVGMVLTILFGSLRKTYEKFRADHCVACFDSPSWRKELFPEYKGDRNLDTSPIKREENEIIHKVLADLKRFLTEHTNVTVLEHKGVEADDFIARWVQLHHDDSFTHIIVSADGDFKQLVRPGVELFDPIRTYLYTSEGIYYQDGKKPRKGQLTVHRHDEEWKVKVTKEGEPETFDPEWELFYKCIRGKKNNLRSAYPRVREVKMREAFDDRGGPKWNDFINAIWGEADNRQSVRERYEFNKSLLDLRMQPPEIRTAMDEAINEALDKKPRTMVGAYFAQFCGKYRLKRLVDQSASISQLLASPY